MPTYDYHCPTNNQTMEVRHKIKDVVINWGQLCELKGIDVGNTPMDTPVTRQMSGFQIIKKRGECNYQSPTCAERSGCGYSGCGMG